MASAALSTGSLSVLSGTSALVDPCVIYLLGGEAHSDFHWPLRSIDYSVSECARYVYVVGECARGRRTITVWDLHRGTSAEYQHNINLVRRFYGFNRQFGLAVREAASGVDLVSVFIDHRDRQVTVGRLVHSIQLSPLDYWSSLRCGSGYAVVARSDRLLYVYRYEPAGVGRSTWIDLARMSGDSHRFIGQPFAFGQHLYLHEGTTTGFRDHPSGRLFRIDMDRGSICISRTSTHGFTFGDGQSLPHKVKNVERNGELWLIAEADVAPRECFIAVLSLRTFRWRRVQLEVRAEFENLLLDITGDGNVVMLTRGPDAMCGTPNRCVESFSTFSTRQVPSLERCAFLTLLRSYPAIRHLPTSNLVSMGIPKKYLD